MQTSSQFSQTWKLQQTGSIESICLDARRWIAILARQHEAIPRNLLTTTNNQRLDAAINGCLTRNGYLSQSNSDCPCWQEAIRFYLVIRAVPLRFATLPRTNNALLKKDNITNNVVIFTYLDQKSLVANDIFPADCSDHSWNATVT